MYLRPIALLNPEDRELLRVKKGDTVIFDNGDLYVADEVGMTYVQMHLLRDNRIKAFAKLQQVTKWFPPEPEELPADRQRLDKLFPGLRY